MRRRQVLVELESDAERTALEAAGLRAAMEAQVQNALCRREAAQKKLARRDDLMQEKLLVAKGRDDSAADPAQAEAAVVEAKASRRLAEPAQKRLQEWIAQHRIRSPIQGMVIDRVVDSASGTFRVHLGLPNPKDESPAG